LYKILNGDMNMTRIYKLKRIYGLFIILILSICKVQAVNKELVLYLAENNPYGLYPGMVIISIPADEIATKFNTKVTLDGTLMDAVTHVEWGEDNLPTVIECEHQHELWKIRLKNEEVGKISAYEIVSGGLEKEEQYKDIRYTHGGFLAHPSACAVSEKKENKSSVEIKKCVDKKSESNKCNNCCNVM
jgi:hypothetical protein